MDASRYKVYTDNKFMIRLSVWLFEYTYVLLIKN